MSGKTRVTGVDFVLTPLCKQTKSAILSIMCITRDMVKPRPNMCWYSVRNNLKSHETTYNFNKCLNQLTVTIKD